MSPDPPDRDLPPDLPPELPGDSAPPPAAEAPEGAAAEAGRAAGEAAPPPPSRFGRLKLRLPGGGSLARRIGSSVRRSTPDAPCRNCGDATVGPYCRSCGQRKLEVRVSLRRMLLEAVEDQLLVNSTLPRTLKGLFFHPGRLTREYVDGRIVSYVPPFRLYLIASLIFFVTVRLTTDLAGLSRDIDRENAADDSIAAVDTAAARIRASTPPSEDPETPGEALRMARDSLRRRSGAARPGGGVQTPRGSGISVNADSGTLGLNVSPDTARVARWLKPMARRLQLSEDRLNAMSPGEAVRTLVTGFVRHAPTGMFVMMPVFALILKLLYIRRKRFYVEHFVFALHVHAFAFLLFTAVLLVRADWIATPLFLWFLVYLYLAMKKFYAQGWFRTLVKYGVLGSSYLFVSILGFAVTLMLTALTL